MRIDLSSAGCLECTQFACAGIDLPIVFVETVSLPHAGSTTFGDQFLRFSAYRMRDLLKWLGKDTGDDGFACAGSTRILGCGMAL